MAFRRVTDRTLGRRLPNQRFHQQFPFEFGDYGYDPESGLWWIRAPRGRAMPLEDHRVIEHEYGSISVEPLIRIEPVGVGDRPWCSGWKGFLIGGVWKEI